MEPQQQPNNPLNAPIGQQSFPRPFFHRLAYYLSLNELKRLRLVCKDFNASVMDHPQFLNSTLLMGKKFPEKFAEMRRIKGSDDILPWRNARVSLRRLERCEFVRNFWKTRMVNHIRKLEMYNVGHKCSVVGHFIGALPVLEELILNDVSFRSRNVIDFNQGRNAQVAVYCDHDGAAVVFNHEDVRRDNTIRKIEFRKIPIIPTCLIQFLTVRSGGVLEEYHCIDNTLPAGVLPNYRPAPQTQQRHVKNMLRVNLVTLRKVTWANCPVDPEFVSSLTDRAEFPVFNFTDLHFGQFEGIRDRNLGHIQHILAVPVIPTVLRTLKLEFWQRMSPTNLNDIQQAILLCPGLTSLSITVHSIVATEDDYEFQPGLQQLENLRHVEIRQKYDERTTRWRVYDILDNAHLPVNLESLSFCGLVGVFPDPFMNYLNSLIGVQPLKKLILSDNDYQDTIDALNDQAMQMILRKFPLLEELVVSRNELITDTAFTGIPKKTVKMINESESYTLLAHAELNLPPTAQSLSNLKRLKKLALTGLNISDVTVFRGLELPCLRELDISYSNVTDVGLMQLPLKAPGLETLRINCCQYVSTLGVCLLLKHSQIQNLTTTQTVLERDHPGLKYSFPTEATQRSAKIFVDHNPKQGLFH